MSVFDNQRKQALDRPYNSSFNGQTTPLNNNYGGSNYYNASSQSLSAIIDFLDRKFRKTQVHLLETPCYFYKGKRSKLEVTVYANPQIAKIDIRMIALDNHDREPSYQCSYDLNGLSIAVFKRAIEDLISQMA